MTRNSKEKKKNVNRKCLATRSKRQAEQTASQAPTKCQPGAPVTNHLAVTGHRRAVSFAPYLLNTAWRWDPSARRQCSLMWQVGSFSSVFAKGNESLAFWRHEEHIWRAWRSARACGNSSIFLFVSLSLPSLSFASLSSPWQWRAKPIFVGVRCSHETLV